MDTSARQQFDVVVIGSGPGGYKAAMAARQQGANVALVEKGLAGGTCLNQGCVPKESLIKLARLIDDVNSFQQQGINGGIKGDFAQAMQRKSAVVNSIRETLNPWLRQQRIRLFQGHACFINPTAISVENDQQTLILEAKKFIIATGSRPMQHPLLKTDGQHIFDSRQFMFNEISPGDSVLCVGGGAIGTELAYLFHQFDRKVCIVEQEERLLPKPCIPARASDSIARKFKKLGVQLRLQQQLSHYEQTSQGIEVHFSNGDHEHYDSILVAIGRQANTEGLGLDKAGVSTNSQGFIITNEFLQTSNSAVYAVGDVKTGPMTANAAFHDAKIAALNVVKGNQAVINYNRVPIVIDTVIPIASVGLTVERAEQAGFEAEVARINLAGSTKARINQDSDGYIEVVHDEETGQLLGGSIMGPQAGEMIHLLTAACQSSRGLWFFTDISYSHPSWNEELENAIGSCLSSFDSDDDKLFKPGIYANGFIFR